MPTKIFACNEQGTAAWREPWSIARTARRLGARRDRDLPLETSTEKSGSISALNFGQNRNRVDPMQRRSSSPFLAARQRHGRSRVRSSRIVSGASASC